MLFQRLRSAVRRRLIVLFLVAIPVPFWPAWWCGREADAVFDARSFEPFAPLVAQVEQCIGNGVRTDRSITGHWQYDGEWNLVTWQMSGIGLCQLVKRFPEQKSRLAPLIERSIDRLLDPATREFETRSWNEDAIDGMPGPKGHLAFLGYANVLLSLWRTIEPENRFAAINDRISEALVRRYASSPIGLIETYPREVYPIDNTPALASLALWQRATGRGGDPLLPRLLEQFQRRYRDPVSGLLYQRVFSDSGLPDDKPRASGTALAAYFLSFADPALSRDLYQSLKTSCRADLFGFTAFLEYPPNVAAGEGDVDSGPVIFGLSFSGTAFGLAPARIHGDREVFSGIYRQLFLFGFPIDSDGRRSFALGGPLGNAVVLALLTAGEPANR